MQILTLGGTGFIGSDVVHQLSEMGHEVTVFHRGQTQANLPPTVNSILGDYRNLPDFVDEFKRVAPQVVLDMIPATERDAETVMSIFKGIVDRVVAISSGDVYRAYGVLHRTEPGPVQPVPIKENAPLRQSLYPFRGSPPPPGAYEFLNREDYDKILVERMVMGDPDLPGTILRLPMVYGPRDPLHRLFPYLKRMDDNRSVILLQADLAGWQSPRGYVENVAAAISLAVVDNRATGQIYNVAEAQAFTEAEWVRRIGQLVGWKGEVVAVPKEQLPDPLKLDFNLKQQWVVDTTPLREELGYNEPVSLEEALRRTIAWERTHSPAETPQLSDYAAEDTILAELE